MNRSNKNDNKIRVCDICEEKKAIKNYAKLGRGYSRVCRQCSCSSVHPAKTTINGRKIYLREYYAKKLIKVEDKANLFARIYKRRKTNMITSSFLMNEFKFSNSYVASYFHWCKSTGRDLPLIL